MKKFVSMFAFLLMVTTLLVPANVFAWSDGDDDTDQDNKQTIVAQQDGNIAVNGQIGTFNNNEKPDPVDPLPPDGDDAWINVTIPTTMIFASTQADNLNIIGPKYKVINNSARGVDVYAKEFQMGANNISGTTLNLETLDPEFATVETPSVNLLNGTDDSTLATETHIATLDAGEASGGNPGDLIDTNKGQVKIKMSGSLPDGYTYGSTVNPSYTLVLKFKAH